MLGSRQETVDHAMALLMEEDHTYPVKGYHPDLHDVEAVQAMLKDVTEKFGSVDILVNNAGVSDATSIYAYDDDHFMDVLKINVDAVFRLSRLVAPVMKEKGKGVIINVSSMVSLYGLQTCECRCSRHYKYRYGKGVRSDNHSGDGCQCPITTFR